MREAVVADLRQLLLFSGRFRVFLTSRAGEFRWKLENAHVRTLVPLTEGLIRQFAVRWLGSEKATTFLRAIEKSPYAGTEVRPLTLAYLCAIYERGGGIPEKPKTVYRRVSRIYLEEWDEERLIRRVSRYAEFEVDRKEGFLKALAYELTLRTDATTFSHTTLEDIYRDIHADFGLPARQARLVAAELESHTGLIVQVDFEEYEFSHKALQEYLAAEHIRSLPLSPSVVVRLPNELAIAVALSSRSYVYFIGVVDALVRRSGNQSLRDFTPTFLGRLVVERADLRPVATLGWAYLLLFAETHFIAARSGSVVRVDVEPETMESFWKRQDVVSAVTAALGEADVQGSSETVWSVAPRMVGQSSLPRTLWERLRTTYDGRLPLSPLAFGLSGGYSR